MVYCGKPSKGCSNCRERKIRHNARRRGPRKRRKTPVTSFCSFRHAIHSGRAGYVQMRKCPEKPHSLTPPEIRCDQREPGCGQCDKRQQQCPGYRNLVDLMFRDESSHVIKKATKARTRRKGASAVSSQNIIVTASSAASSTASPENPDLGFRAKSVSRTPGRTPEPSGSAPRMNLALLTPNSNASDGIEWRIGSEANDDLLPSPDEGTWPTIPSTALHYTIAPSFQERGTAFFFARYVAGDDNACHQNYDFIYDIWKPGSLLPDRQVDGVMASMTAVGLAGLSSLTRCEPMMDWARRSYGTALRLTNEALKNAREAIKDSTMLSVLILGTYEMLTGRTPQTVKAWQEHVNGAAALVKMRGTTQFHTKAGIRMFMMSHQTVMIACMQQDIPMPPALVDLRDELGKLIGNGEPGWRIPEPIYKALQVRYDVHRGFLTDTDVIIEKLTTIDEECSELSTAFPDAWAYQTVSIPRPHPTILGDRCHVYPTLLIANAWNGLRTIRLLAHETILGEIIKSLGDQSFEVLPRRHKIQLALSVAILQRVRDAIVASVPQYFGVVSFRDTLSPDPSSVIAAKNPPQQVIPSPVSDATTPVGPSFTSTDFTCPTLLDPMQNKGTEEDVERFMTIASASHTIVWPLYLIGMASCCTQEIKEYAIERLLQVHREGALVQARSVACMVQEKELCCPWADMTFDDLAPVEPPSSPI